MSGTDPDDHGMEDVGELRAKGQFADVIMICWGHIEIYLGLLTSYEFFGMYNDTWVEEGFDLISDLRADWKLSYLKMKGSITEKEYQTIKKFQIKRNKLFHLYGDAHMTGQEKDAIMSDAIEAAWTAEDAYHEIVERGRKHLPLRGDMLDDSED